MSGDAVTLLGLLELEHLAGDISLPPHLASTSLIHQVLPLSFFLPFSHPLHMSTGTFEQ